MMVSQASSMEAAGWAADSQSVARPTPMSSPRTSTRPSVHVTRRSPGATGTRAASKGTPPTPMGAPVGSSRSFAAAVGGPHDHRQDVPRVGQVQLADDRVVDRVQARREIGVAEPLRQVVEVAQELGRGQIEGGHRLHGGAQLPHHRGRVEAVAHHVADDERGPGAGQFDGVEPVAADPAEQRAGQIAGGDVTARHVRFDVRQHAVLERLGDGLLVRCTCARCRARARRARRVRLPVTRSMSLKTGRSWWRSRIMNPRTTLRALSGTTSIERCVISGRMSRFSNCDAIALPISSEMYGTSTGSPLVMHWKNGVCTGNGIDSPTGTTSSQRPGSSVCSRATRCHMVVASGEALREPFARDDLFAQVRAGDVGEAGHDGPADLEDGPRQIEGTNRCARSPR